MAFSCRSHLTFLPVECDPSSIWRHTHTGETDPANVDAKKKKKEDNPWHSLYGPGTRFYHSGKIMLPPGRPPRSRGSEIIDRTSGGAAHPSAPHRQKIIDTNGGAAHPCAPHRSKKYLQTEKKKEKTLSRGIGVVCGRAERHGRDEIHLLTFRCGERHHPAAAAHGRQPI